LVASAALLALGNTLRVSSVSPSTPTALQATSTLHGMRRQRPPGYPPLYSWKALHGAGLPFIKAAVAARALYLSAVTSHHARHRSRTSQL
jgi:hypothetical protein